MSPQPATGAWQPPSQVEEYRLLRSLGSGRTGQVWLAHDSVLDRHVALKFILTSGLESISRFLVEARAAARIQHPNVATLYRVGTLGDRAYLVSEFVAGIPLDRIARPIAGETLLDIAIDLARGLAAAHREGVLHRDVKPANAIFSETRELKLLDFGLAQLERGALDPEAAVLALPRPPTESAVGTPYYMSPEAWAGESISARSDVYSAGAVLYELASGRAPFRHVAPSDLPSTVASMPAAPLASVAAGVDPRLASVIDRCLARAPEDRYANGSALLDALLDVQSAASAAPAPDGNPYRGLRTFEAEHRAVFFGRGREIRSVCERLRVEGFVAITGDSGAGKSSLCLAGVLPSVEGGILGDGRSWRTLRLVPGRRPVESLSEGLRSWLGGADLTALSPADALREIRRALARDGLLVYVDQLEELVTLAAPEDAATAARFLGLLADGIPGIRLLASARSDFLSRLAALPGLGERLPRAIHLLRPLAEDALREAIVAPARICGARFEDEATVDSLAAAGAQNLPLLQFALARLWDARDTARAVIPATALERIGGVEGALARHADELLESFLPEERSAARRILLRLVTLEGTRLRRRDDELLVENVHARSALEALVRGRLVVAGESGGGAQFEIAHEALVTRWATLAGWLFEERETREIQARLEAAAQEWRRTGRAGDALWGARALEEAERIEKAALTPLENEFLAASRRALRTARRRRIALVAGTIAGAAVLVFAVKAGDRMEMARKIEGARTGAESVTAVARSLDDRYERLRAEAVSKFDAADAKAGEEAWSAALAARTEADTRFVEAAEAWERLVSLAGGRADIRSGFSAFLATRARRALRDGRPELGDALLQRLRSIDPDGHEARSFAAPALVSVDVHPAGANTTLLRFDRKPDGSRSGVRVDAGAPPWSLDPGSYLLLATAADREEARLPFVVSAGEERQLSLSLPRRRATPEGFVRIPAGRFLFGSGAEESLREYFKTAPIHSVELPGFLIATHETTFGEWLAYLETLPPPKRARRLPRVTSTGFHGGLALTREPGGRWRIALQPGERRYEAAAGEPIRYGRRDRRQEQDWRRFPVSGVSAEDARAYAAWLHETGRVPRARLCTEHEWERAARGADDREYPHGDRLAPDDANFDQTYGRHPLGFGPDEVGSHPTSASPFGVHDLSGNVWEWVDSSLEPGAVIARGGSYYFSASTTRVVNRETPEPTLRDLTVGVRICADLPPGEE